MIRSARPLTLAAAIATPPARKSSGFMPRMNRPTVILIVDDDTDGREMCARFLETCGFAVLMAPDGGAGIEMAFERAPDLILMDLEMPGMGGIEALRRLKGDDRTQSIPVVVLSGAPLALHDEATRAGCTAFLVKPCSAIDLEGVVRAIVATNAEASVNK